jgi:GrpB-like predicted nucleotidyltransferase (UPF0157 family)
MIRIDPYNSFWSQLFAAEAASIRDAMGALALRVDHVGSTSVPGLAAKPVIDIQVSVATLTPLVVCAQPLAQIGYTHVPLGEFDLVYPFFQKPAEWPTTHHIHLCVHRSELERRHLAFRDYLCDHSRVAADYEALKRRLASENDGVTLESRERYSLSKTEFVTAVLERALSEGYPLHPHDEP